MSSSERLKVDIETEEDDWEIMPQGLRGNKELDYGYLGKKGSLESEEHDLSQVIELMQENQKQVSDISDKMSEIKKEFAQFNSESENLREDMSDFIDILKDFILTAKKSEGKKENYDNSQSLKGEFSDLNNELEQLSRSIMYSNQKILSKLNEISNNMNRSERERRETQNRVRNDRGMRSIPQNQREPNPSSRSERWPNQTENNRNVRDSRDQAQVGNENHQNLSEANGNKEKGNVRGSLR